MEPGRSRNAMIGGLGAILAAASVALQAADTKAPTDAQLIASAVSAAPARIGRDATVMTMGAEGAMRTIRQGTNGFTCMPDDPSTPGPDPMCLDRNAMAWMHAMMAHKAPAAGQVGFVYMLAGGSDASNTDPFAQAPAPGRRWITTGPHVMVVGADASFYAAYPGPSDPDTSLPYVMWPGTPYQHLMAPVK